MAAWDCDPSSQVKFSGEDGIDAGGVYREGLQRMVEDVFSDRFTLLLPVPNALRHSGDNMSSFVPNPKHTSPRSMEMLVFLGRLMGLSLRHKSSLPFHFPSLVWKPIVGLPLDAEDLFQVLCGVVVCGAVECVVLVCVEDPPRAGDQSFVCPCAHVVALDSPSCSPSLTLPLAYAHTR